MASVVELHDFQKRGEPGPIEAVTAVAPSAIDAFIGARSLTERLRHLRRLREDGILIHNKGRLTQRIRGHDVDRAYVFRGTAWSVPPVERAPTRPLGRARVRLI